MGQPQGHLEATVFGHDAPELHIQTTNNLSEGLPTPERSVDRMQPVSQPSIHCYSLKVVELFFAYGANNGGSRSHRASVVVIELAGICGGLGIANQMESGGKRPATASCSTCSCHGWA